jgi:phosphate transport system substrate-binding protein
VVLLCAPCLPSACRRGPDAHRPRVTLAGSTSLQLVAERWAETYAAAAVTVQAGGSTAGIRAARDGTADIGMSSRQLGAEERAGLRETVVAVDGIVVVVHPRNPVRGLTRAQLRALFAGRVRSWQGVGGADAPVVVVTREEGSGTRATFEALVMGEEPVAQRALVTAFSGGLRRMVADDPDAVGYMTISQIGPGVRVLAVDGVAPTERAIASGAYPLHRPLLFVTRPTPPPPVGAFMRWVLSPAGQAVVRAERLVPAAPGAITARGGA